MQIDRLKLDVALARAGMCLSDIRAHGMRPETLGRIRNDPSYQPLPKTVGKIAKALNVDVTEIIVMED